MPIKTRTLSIALVLAGIIASPAYAAPQAETSSEILMRGARTWDSKARPDLAKQLLEKLLLLEPDSREGLYMMGKMAIRDGKPEVALPYLQRLEKTAPGSPHTLQLSAAYREAAQPIPPSRDLTVAVKPATPSRTLNISRNDTALAVPPFAERKQPVKQTRQASGAAAPEKPKTMPATPKAPSTDKPKMHPAIVKTAPASDRETKLTDQEETDIEARSAALDALDDGDLEKGEKSLTELLTRRPHDDEVLGGLGMVKLRQGKHDEAEVWFTRALAEKKLNKWKSLVATAGFWKYMRLTNDALDANRLAEAEKAISQALLIQPDDPDALTVRGNIRLAENQPDEAERLYRAALAKQGYNVSAIRGLIGILSRSARTDEAIKLVESVHRDYPDELERQPSLQSGLLREEADLYLTTNRTNRALQALEKAVSLAPKDPWSRFSLAKLYISLNMAPLGKHIMEEGAALAPNDPDMHYARALVLIKLDDYAAALGSLDRIPEQDRSAKMREARTQALHQYYFQQAERQITRGNRKEAIRIMSIAQTQASGDYSATEQVAEGWFRLGLPDQGLNAMRALPHPVPLETQVYYASLLNRSGKDQELVEYLPDLHIPDSTDVVTQKHRDTLRDIEFAMAGRQFDQMMAAGRKDQAQQLANDVLNARQLSNADYFRYHRDYFSHAELPANAIPLLEQEKANYPGDTGIRQDLAYAYHQDGQDGKAGMELRELLAMTPGNDINARLRIARLQQGAGDYPGSRQTLDDLAARYPDNPDITLQAGNIARAEGKYSRAADYYRKTKALENQQASVAASTTNRRKDDNGILLNLLPTQSSGHDTPPPKLSGNQESDRIYRSALASDATQPDDRRSGNAAAAERELASLEQGRPGASIETGLDIKSKTASAGTSSYNAVEIPVLARFPIGYDARGSVQVDAITIDPGNLPSAYSEAALFGKIQANQAVPAQPLTTRTSGTSVGLGYEQDSVKADIGVSGIGFPVTNLVGGIRKGGDIGRMSYSLTLSRRPETGSQVSYSGAKDPVSGVAWGGVTNTGVSLYLSTSLESLNVSTYAAYGLLRGKNVQNNDRLYLRATIDHDLYASDDMVLNLGLNANFMRYSRNLSGYTFGQGGYYSPQSSLSFGIPLDLRGREELLSYQLQASLSYSFTREDSSVFYPTDIGLQTLASAGPNFPAGYNQAIYSGGKGGGLGFGLRGALEYRVTPHFVAGGKFTIERSAYYYPNSVMFYLKYLFKPETGQVKLTPTPVIPYSQY